MITNFFDYFFDCLNNKTFKFLSANYADESPVFENLYLENNQSKLTIIYGDNASGKSLFGRIAESHARKSKIHVRSASMNNRIGNGDIEKSFQRAMIFGDQSVQSTGATSLKVAIKCLRATLSDDQDSITSLSILDEPDIGLSDRFSTTLGLYISQQLKLFNQSGIILICHNKQLIERLLNDYQLPVNFVGINTHLNYFDWYNSLQEATIEELLQLDNIGFKKESAIDKTQK